MTVDRRSFFKGGIIATLFAGIPGSVTALAGQLQKKPTRASSPKLFRVKSLDDLAPLSMASFSPFTDTTFRVRSLTTKMLPVTVTLVRVTDLRQTPDEIALAREGRESFALEFVGPNSRSLPQGMYQFSNDSLGAFSMMIVPGAEATFSATINRLYS